MRTHPGNAVVKYSGLILFLALMIGGGTVQGLWTDYLLQIALLPVIYAAFKGFRLTAIGWAERLLLVAVLGFLIVQFIPQTRDFPAVLGLDPMAGIFTNSPQKALNSMLFVLSAYPFFLLVQRMSEKQQASLVGFVLLGLLVNLIVSVLQLSASQTLILATPLPYDILGGLFANPNHFSALVYVSIPLLAWQLLHQKNSAFLFVGATIILALFTFAVGSAAAMGLTVILAIISLLTLPKNPRFKGLKLALALTVILLLAAALLYWRDPAALQNNGRLEIFQTTWLAILDYWPKGSGLGSFVEVYRLFEPVENITAEFTNHAHNDFLELLLEGGVIAAIILAIYLIILVTALPGKGLKRAALLAVLALLAHSAVDYPLRTMALALVFATLNGIALRRHD